MANVIIYLDSADFSGSALDSAPEMRQVNETFKPHVLAVVAGSSVDFPNEDPFFHRLSLSRPSPLTSAVIRRDHPNGFVSIAKAWCPCSATSIPT